MVAMKRSYLPEQNEIPQHGEGNVKAVQKSIAKEKNEEFVI